MKDFRKILGKGALLFLIMMILCGLLYTLAMTGISALFFKDKANGSIIEVDGVKYGSGLLAYQAVSGYPGAAEGGDQRVYHRECTASGEPE